MHFPFFLFSFPFTYSPFLLFHSSLRCRPRILNLIVSAFFTLYAFCILYIYTFLNSTYMQMNKHLQFIYYLLSMHLLPPFLLFFYSKPVPSFPLLLPSALSLLSKYTQHIPDISVRFEPITNILNPISSYKMNTGRGSEIVGERSRVQLLNHDCTWFITVLVGQTIKF